MFYQSLRSATCSQTPVSARRPRQIPTSFLPVPLSARGTHCSHRYYQTAAVIPIPLIGVSLVAGAALLLVNLAPITERILTRVLHTDCKIDGLSIRPFRRKYAVKGLQLFDPRGRPLVSVKKGQLSIARNEDGKRVLDVELTSPELVTIFDSYDFSESNWTLLASKFRKSKTEPSAGAPAEVLPTVTELATPKRKKSRSEVNVRVVDGVVLSVRSDAVGGKRLIDDMLIRDVQVSSEDFENFESMKALVDNLSVRAIKSFPVRSFPREFRAGARRYVSMMLSKSTMDRLNITKKSIKKLREHISFADDFVLKDMPDMQRASEAAKTAQNVLRGFESLLGGGTESTESPQVSEKTSTDAVERSEVEKDSSSVAEPSGNLRDQYRELDEGPATASGR